MKRFFLVAGLLALLNPTFAQHKHGQEYNKSVFRNFSPQRNNDAIQQTNNAAMSAFPGWSINVDKATGNITDIYGPAMNIPGGTNIQRAQHCIQNQLSKLGATDGEWVMQHQFENDKLGRVDFVQVINNHKVAFSKLAFFFTPDGKLIRLQMKNYGVPQNYTSPVLTIAAAEIAAQQEMPGANITANNIGSDWQWFPVPAGNSYELHPAYSFNITGTDEHKEEMKLRGYVDGVTGEVLYRVNDVKFDYDIAVKGVVKAGNFADPATLQPLPNIKISVNGADYFTDVLGYFAIPGMNLPQNTTVALAGRWSVVKDVPSNITAPTVSTTVTTLGSSYTYPTSADIEVQHLTAYYHVNIVHDFMKSFYSNFTGMDVALPTNVDLTNNSCNAFYNGSSINFYAATSGCNSFAEVRDIVYHEYGHGINDKFYNAVSGNSMDNGGLNEGYADMWGMGITNEPVLGAGAFSSGGFIRRYDVNPKVYPMDLTGEVHADGEIIAGAWWDTRMNIGSMATTAGIFAESLYFTPDGPEGTEGEVYHEALISALMADDDDNNINNGTPHFLEIVTGFAAHGIYLLSDATITHTEVGHPAESAPVTINASLQITYQPFLKDVILRYRLRPSTTWTDVPMTETSPLQYTAEIPGQLAGNVVDYFFVVRDTLSLENAYAPKGFTPLLNSTKSNIPYQYGVQLVPQVTENFENTLNDWIVGNFTGGFGILSTDDATAGKWIQAEPIGSSNGGQASQTNNDHTTGNGKCLVTGNANSVGSVIGAADVDGGITTVVTPLFNIAGYSEPIIEYYRWYSNNGGSNPNTENFDVRIGSTTSSIWFSVDNTNVSDQSWRRRIFRVRDYLPNPNSVEIRLFFRAEDKTNNGGAVVEAAVDDFIIYSKGWPASVGNVAVEKADIYPNPSDELVNVQLPAQGYGTGTIGIFDFTGKKISEVAIVKGQSTYTIDTKNIAAGSYFLIVQAEQVIQSQKIVVAH